MARIIDQERYLMVDLTKSKGHRSLVIALALFFVFIPLIYWRRAPQGMSFLVWILMAILLATLVATIFFSRKFFFKIVFDRTERVIEYLMGAWVWQKRMKIPFADVKTLKISPKPYQKSSSWELKLETNAGETWPLYHSMQEAELRRFAGQAAQTLGCSLTDETATGAITYAPAEIGLSLRERYRQGKVTLKVSLVSPDSPIKIEDQGGKILLSSRRKGPKIFMAAAFGVFLGIVALQFTLLYARVLSQAGERDPMMMKIVVMYVIVTILLFGFATLFLWRRFGAQKLEIAEDKLTFYHGPRYGFIPLEEIKDITATTGGGYPKIEIIGKDKILTLTGWGDRAQSEGLAEKLKELVVKTG